jgi:glycosyltransferase involved in cell wall biosynthesis
MIVKNEAATLVRCLDATRAIAAEIVIVDTGSTDRTIEIAQAYNARIARFEFTVIDFAAARNRSIELASGHWILVLDADETLDPASVPLVADLASRNQNAGYYFERLNHYGDSRKPTRDHVLRLFPNRPTHRYRGRVHETVDASILGAGGKLIPTSIRIDHDFSLRPEFRAERNLRYIEILKEEIRADPSDHSRLDFLAAEYHQVGMFAEATQIRERIALLRPFDPEAHLRAGLCHFLYGIDSERAGRFFREALRLRPGYGEAQRYLDLSCAR